MKKYPFLPSCPGAAGAGILCGLLALVQLAPAVTIQTIYSGTNGLSGLVAHPNGYLYGTTPYGGTSDLGTVFSLTTAGTAQLLYSFSGTADGANPKAALLAGADGSLYGTAPFGGANAAGSIFKITPAGSFTLLHSFAAAQDGADPEAGLVIGTNGVLYGTASYGGASGLGTVFQITTNGTFTTLHNFAGADGSLPGASLTVGTDGLLYGTTQYGGTSNRGTVFTISTAGNFNSLLSFNGVNGGNPQAALVQGSDGAFYGTTTYGGTGEFGSVFKVTMAGALTPLYSPSQESLGSNPSAGLAVGSDGNLYGAANYGGTNNFGALFSTTTAGVFTALYSFMGTTDGANPANAMALGTDGNLYGTTAQAGGSVFELASPFGISQQPTGRTNYVGTSVSFSVTAAGPGPYTYAWFKNGTPLRDGGPISGAGSSVLTIDPITQYDTAIYTVVVGNGVTSVTSSNASLTVVVIVPLIATSVLSPDGRSVTFSGTVGDPNGQYTVLTSTDITAPTATWTPIYTNFFNGVGAFNFTFPVNANETSRFYRLRSP